MATAILGGAFDPMHIGHAALARKVRERFAPAEFIILPSGAPPHKRGVTSARHRLEICRLVSEGEAGVTVSDMEIKTRGASYTYRTLERFNKTLGEKPLFVIGSDALSGLEKWKEPAAVAKNCEFIVVRRAGAPPLGADFLNSLRVRYGAVIRAFDADGIPDVSSTEVRLLNSFGRDISPLVGQKAAGYIKANNLYRNYAVYADALAGLLDEERLRHTLSVARVALKLAARYGADTGAAVRAALLHDCAKNITADAAEEKYGLKAGADIRAMHPKVRHGALGALYAEKFFNETDPDVLNAVRYHTTGRAAPSLMEKIIFVADYIDPLRAYEDTPKTYALAFDDLDAAAECKYREIERARARAGTV